MYAPQTQQGWQAWGLFETLFPLTREGVFPVDAAFHYAKAQNLDQSIAVEFIAVISDVIARSYLKDLNQHD